MVLPLDLGKKSVPSRVAIKVTLFAAAMTIVAAVRADDPSDSTYAGRSLGAWTELLADHLDGDSDEDKEACRRAAHALGQIGPAAEDAIPLLVRALSNPSREVRHFAVDALGRMGPVAASAVAAILAEVDISPDHVNYTALAYFRRVAARALGRIGPAAQDAVPVLQRAMENEDSFYQVEAALALWKIQRHPASVPKLVASLGGNDPDITYAAIMALHELGQDAKPAQKPLIAALGHASPDVQRAAAEALSEFDPAVLEPVANWLRDEMPTDPQPALYVLGVHLERLRRDVFDRQDLTSAQFAQATQPLVRVVGPVLVSQLSHPRKESRDTAIRSLSAMGLVAVPFLLRPLASEDLHARQSAVSGLARLEGFIPTATATNPGLEQFKVRILPRLMELMQHEDDTVREATFRIFAALDYGPQGSVALPLLRTALRNPSVSIRRHAAKAIRAIQGNDDETE